MREIVAIAAFVALVAAANACVDLNGSWDFRFEEGKSIEQVARHDFKANDTMVVPVVRAAFSK